MAINAAPLIPPAFHVIGVHANGNRVGGVAVLGHRRDIDIERRVTVPVVMHRRAVEPDRAVRCDAVELQFQVFAAIGRIQLELASIPGDSTLAIPLRFICFGIPRLFNHPIVRQIEFSPSLVVELRRCRAPGARGFGAPFSLVAVCSEDGVRNITEMKPPAMVQRQRFPR